MSISNPYEFMIVVLEKVSNRFCKNSEKELSTCSTTWLINVAINCSEKAVGMRKKILRLFSVGNEVFAIPFIVTYFSLPNL